MEPKKVDPAPLESLTTRKISEYTQQLEGIPDMSEVGTKELDELNAVIRSLVLRIIDASSDGLTLGDLDDLILGAVQDREMIMAAIKGTDKLKAEIADLDVDEQAAQMHFFVDLYRDVRKALGV